MEFAALLIIVAVVYFGLSLPLLQALSRRLRGRKFVIRLGTPWKFNNPDHRWDVLFSAVSFIIALAVSIFLFDHWFPFTEG